MIGLVGKAFRRDLEAFALGEARPAAFPLALAKTGERVRISGVKAGKGLTHRLRELGLPVGSVITIQHRNASAGMVVARDSLRIGLGEGLAHKVMVSLAEKSADGTE
jgi:ferrous iron transport protein A